MKMKVGEAACGSWDDHIFWNGLVRQQAVEFLWWLICVRTKKCTANYNAYQIPSFNLVPDEFKRCLQKQN